MTESPEMEAFIRKHLVTMQIISAALAAGVVFFAGIVLFIPTLDPNPGATPVISYAALLGLVANLAARATVLPVMKATMRQKLGSRGRDWVAWLPACFQRNLVGAALLEGAAFLALVAYLLEGQPWALAAAVVALALQIVLHLPTRERVEAWCVAAAAETVRA